MITRIARTLLAVAAGLLLLALAVANPHPVSLALDPFNDPPALALELPFFAYIFAALMLGVLLGGMSTWVGQSRWRRTARARTQDAMRLQAEADRLTRERDQYVSSSKKLIAPRA